jgi:hypothetical protein
MKNRIPAMKTNPLNPRQQAFCNLVLAGTPAGRAWEQAGFQARGNSADVQACKALKKPKIRAYLKNERERMQEAGRMERHELVAHLTDVIRTPIGQLTPESPLVQKYFREELAGGMVRTRVEMESKLEACKLLSIIMGWQAPEKHELDASDAIKSMLAKIRSR